jgi:hypothetical protein
VEIPKSQHPLQFGFTKGISPQLAALCVTEALAEADHLKRPLYVVTLDAQKAFDVVNHDILFRQMLVDDAPRHTVALLQDLYSGCTEFVAWQGKRSPEYDIKQGVKQGGIISTNLYKLYIDDLLERITQLNIGTKIGHIILGAVACADDVALLIDTLEDAQTLVDESSFYANSHLYSLHPVKSVASLRNAPWNGKELQFQGKAMPKDPNITHLGLTRDVSTRNMMKEEVLRRIQVGRSTVYAMMKVGLHGQNGLNPTASVRLLDLYVLPKVMYGLEAVLLQVGDMDQLEMFHKKLLKQLQGLHEKAADPAVYLLAGTLPLRARLDISRINLLLQVFSLSPENPLRRIGERQLKQNNHYSWFCRTNDIIKSYNLELSILQD